MTKFRLDTLLRLRVQVRDRRRVELSEAYRAEDVLEQREVELNGMLERLRDEYRDLAQAGKVPLDRLVESQRYELVLKAECQSTRDQKDLIAKEVEKRRIALVDADREVRVLEKLREKQRKREDIAERRRDNIEMDEVSARLRMR